MKKKHLFLGLMAGALLTGCSSDNDITGGETTLTRNTTGFLRVNIAQGGIGTKADFDDGLDSERKLNSLLFVFYDAAGRSIATQKAGATDIKWETTGEGGWNHSNANGNVSDDRSLVVKVNLSSGTVIPSQVMVFANFKNESQSSTGIDGLNTLTRDDYKDNNGYFTMNNSVYFDGNVKKMAVPISIDEFKDSEEAAKAGTGITVHLERLAAKVALTINDATNIKTVEKNTETAETKLYLKFVPTGWGLNAVEKSTYLVKNFGEASYTTLNSELSGWTGWNDATNKRCYWGYSPTYNETSNYPQVRDDLVDDGDARYTKLDYFTYTELTKGGSKSAAFVDDLSTSEKTENALYCLENTAPAKVLNGDYRNSAITSAIITGEYHVYTNEADAGNAADSYMKIASGTDAGKPITFYIYDDKIYTSEADMIKKLAGVQYVIMKKKGTEAPVKLTEAEYAKVFNLAHPLSAVRGKNKVGESHIALQVKSSTEALEDGYSLVYLTTSGTYAAYSATAQADANKSLISYLGYTEIFNQGKAYFGVGIRHLRELPAADADGKITYLTGNYGVLRNHSYNIKINSIDGLGTGIQDPSHKIVLPTQTISYNVKTTLNILSWRVVSTQEVDLKDPVQ